MHSVFLLRLHLIGMHLNCSLYLYSSVLFHRFISISVPPSSPHPSPDPFCLSLPWPVLISPIPDIILFISSFSSVWSLPSDPFVSSASIRESTMDNCISTLKWVFQHKLSPLPPRWYQIWELALLNFQSFHPLSNCLFMLKEAGSW